MNRTAVVVLVTAGTLFGSPLSAQPAPPLEHLLDRMGAYLTEYESQLSSLVADERFEQNVYSNFNLSVTLESEVSFIRLPGGAEWLGFRDVKKVSGRPVASAGPSVRELLTLPAPDLTKALAIANGSAKHNLGLPRTINLPTGALDIIHPLHRSAHAYELLGNEAVRGTRTMVVAFRETARPSLLQEPSGLNLFSSGRIWIEPSTGTVWRVEWIYLPEKRPSGPPPRLLVDFVRHDELRMMVPATMTEVFSVQNGRGQGRATYRNFRRFGTSARILPQHP
jgi:hypothetical protein